MVVWRGVVGWCVVKLWSEDFDYDYFSGLWGGYGEFCGLFCKAGETEGDGEEGFGEAIGL